jgi:hypothetical protein
LLTFFFFFIFKALIVSAGSSGYTDLVFGVQWSWTEAEERAEQLQGLSDCVSRRLDQGTIYHKNPEWKPEREKELCNIWILPWGGRRRKPLPYINTGSIFFFSSSPHPFSRKNGMKKIFSGRELNDDIVVDYATECFQTVGVEETGAQGSSSSSSGGSVVDVKKKANPTADIKLVASAVDQWLRPLARRRHGWVALKRVRLQCSCHSSGSKSPKSVASVANARPCSNLRPVSERRKVDFHYYH